MKHYQQDSDFDRRMLPPPARNLALRADGEALTPRYELAPPDEPEVSELGEYWRIVLRYKFVIMLFCIGGIILGLSASVMMSPVYRATVTLEVLSLNDDFMNMKQTSPVASNDVSNDTSELQTQAKLLDSEDLKSRVLAKLNGDRPLSPYTGSPATGWRSIFHLPQPAMLTYHQRVLLKTAESLKVRPTPRTRIIEVTVDSTDRALAQTFTDTLANEYLTQNMEMRWKTVQHTSDWLSHEINDARSNLEKSEDALQDYARESGLIFTGDSQDTNIWSEKLEQIQQQLSTATADRISKQARFELAQNSAPDSLPDVLNDQALREEQAKITDLKRQVAELSTTYTPEYSKLRRAQAQLSTLTSSFERDRADIIERVKNDFNDAKRREALLQGAYASQAHEVTGQDQKAIRYNILKREVESNRQLYDTVLQQLKQSSIASALGAAKVRIIDPASVPLKPVSPNLPINAVVGMFSGLFLGLAFSVARERSNRALQEPGDSQYHTSLPELGTIPSAFIPSARGSRGTLTAGRPSASEYKDRKTPYDIESWQQKPTVISEAFRGVLTSILFSGNGVRPRVLVFTSAAAGDGKTTIVTNLGIALAEIETRVLLIDADLRCPRLHEVFKLSNERGLSDLLKRNGREGSFESAVQHTTIPGLDVLTSGAPSHAAANLLYSPTLASILERAREEYGMVLIDTPPMLQMTDARVVGRLADSVILVARAGRTTSDELVAVKQRFAEDNTRVLGTVLNDWNPKNSPYGSYGQRKTTPMVTAGS